MRSNKSYDKKDDCKRDYFKKKSDNAMHNDQSSRPQVPAICSKEGVNLVQDHLCTLVLVLALALALAQAAGATATIMLIKMTASLVQHPSKGIHPSTGTCTPPRVTMADAFIARTKAILCLPPFLLQKQRRSAPRNRKLRQ
jgi:hypothetical protein